MSRHEDGANALYKIEGARNDGTGVTLTANEARGLYWALGRYHPAALEELRVLKRLRDLLRGDKRRDWLIELLGQAHGGFDKDQRETIRIAADQIQNAADLLFHGALTAFDDLGETRNRNACAEFTVRLILSELMDHGFGFNENGLLVCQNTVVEKVGGTVTTTWIKDGSHCDFERHDDALRDGVAS